MVKIIYVVRDDNAIDVVVVVVVVVVVFVIDGCCCYVVWTEYLDFYNTVAKHK